jgi:hypothetical protein
VSAAKRFSDAAHSPGEEDLSLAVDVDARADGEDVEAVVAVEEGDAERGADLLTEADRLRSAVGAPVPAFQVDDVERARRSLALSE